MRPGIADLSDSDLTARALDRLAAEQAEIERTRREREHEQEAAQVEQIERLIDRDERAAIPRLSEIRTQYDARRDAGRVALAALAEFVRADREIRKSLDAVGDSLSAYQYLPQGRRRERFARLRELAGLSSRHVDDSLYLIAADDAERVALTGLYAIVNQIVDAGVVNVGGKSVRFDV